MKVRPMRLGSVGVKLDGGGDLVSCAAESHAAAKKANIEYVIGRLALADELGVKCCVDIAGSFDGKTLSGPHPKNLSREFFDGTVENYRKILDTVSRKRAKVDIEMKAWNMPEGPDSYVEPIRA